MLQQFELDAVFAIVATASRLQVTSKPTSKECVPHILNPQTGCRHLRSLCHRLTGYSFKLRCSSRTLCVPITLLHNQRLWASAFVAGSDSPFITLHCSATPRRLTNMLFAAASRTAAADATALRTETVHKLCTKLACMVQSSFNFTFGFQKS